jgi:putative ABC transport system substrate-binding protein
MVRSGVTPIVMLIVGMVAAPLDPHAQQGAKIPKIGIVQPGIPAASAHLVEAFKRAMRERGYVEGERLTFDARFAEGRRERISEIAAEFVRLVDIIVTSTDPAIAAVQQQTQTIPIVMANSTDPVGTGFVASLPRPGGNITGNTAMSPELSGKRLELLKEVVPGLSRVAILWNPDSRGGVLDYRETETAARSLHLQVQSVEVGRADELTRALSSMTTGRPGR